MVDIRPLRVSRDFRLLWFGQAASFLGTTMTGAAIPLEIYKLTNSSLMVGVLGAVQLVPMLVCSIGGGALADSIDKRLLLLCVTLASLTCSGAFALNASLHHPQLWLMYVLGAISTGLLAITVPVLRSLLPMLVESELRPAAFALQSTYGSLGMMVGPAVGGVLIGVIGFAHTYLIDVASYVIALPLFFSIASSPPVGDGQRASVASIIEGLKFLRGHPVITSVFGIDMLAMIFGMPRALFPALTARLHGGPTLYGFMLASVAAGAFVASITSGWTSRVVRQGRAVIVCVALWGVAIAIAGTSRTAVVVLVLFGVAGGADMISGVYRSAVAADVTPDDLRGRISGVEIAVYGGGPVLGDVEAGVVGGLVNVPFAIISGGLACVAGAAVFATKVPSFAKYERHYDAVPEPIPD
jgi:MFS family permease